MKIVAVRRRSKVGIRVETRSQPEGDGCGECDGGEVVASELVVAGGDAAEVLQPAEHGFDPPAVLVAPLVILDWALAVAAAGDDRRRALGAQGLAQPVGVIAPVGDQALAADGVPEQQVGTLQVGGVARCQRKPERPSEDIDERVDLRRPATARDANGLGLRSPFLAPPEHRCAFT